MGRMLPRLSQCCGAERGMGARWQYVDDEFGQNSPSSLTSHPLYGYKQIEYIHSPLSAKSYVSMRNCCILDSSTFQNIGSGLLLAC